VRTADDVRHLTYDGAAPVCGAVAAVDLVWFVRSVTCPDCLEQDESNADADGELVRKEHPTTNGGNRGT
jgi:hypothetical protein